MKKLIIAAILALTLISSVPTKAQAIPVGQIWVHPNGHGYIWNGHQWILIW